MRKILLAVLAALCALLLHGIQPTAQDQPAKDEPEEYWQTYDLSGLSFGPVVVEEGEMPAVAPVFGAYAPVVRSFDNPGPVIVPWEWRLAHGNRRPPLDVEYLADRLDSAVDHEWHISTRTRTEPQPAIEVLADKAAHDLVAAALQMLKAWYAMTAEIAVYELTSTPADVCLSREAAQTLLKDAKLIGRQSGDPGETLVWRDLDFIKSLTDYEVFALSEEVFPHPVHTKFPKGWEVAAGVFPLPDGKLLVQAALGEGSVVEVRKVPTTHMEIEAPRMRCSYQPACAVLAPGEALVLGGRYLLLPRVDAAPAPVQIGSTFIVPATSVLSVADLKGGDWPGEDEAYAGYPASPEYETLQLLQRTHPDCIGEAVEAFRARESLQGSYLEHIGPLLVVQGEALLEPEEKAQDTEFEDIVQRLKASPRWFSHRVSVYAVDAEGLPEKPTEQQVAGSGIRLYHYQCAALEGQIAQWNSLEAANYFAGSNSVYSTVPAVEPTIWTAVAGLQLELLARGQGAAAGIDILAGYAPTLEISQETVKGLGQVTEYASVPTCQLRLQARLGVGETACAIGPYPGDESKRIVLFAERIR